MAKYAQLHTDDGLAVLNAGLAKEYVLALTFIAQHEDVVIPVREFEKAMKKLAEIGVELSLQRAIGKTLSDNARSKRYYEKKQSSAKESHVRNDVRPHVEPHTDLLHSPIPNPSPAEKEVARKARKPRQPSKGKLALAEFNAAVTQVTGSPSCVTGMANETRAAAFAEAIASAGETMTDAVRRRHGLGKSLTLHWMMNDYAGDRTTKRLAPVNTGNNLRQPHPRDIPTDPEEARKYWLGEPDEQRFDWG